MAFTQQQTRRLNVRTLADAIDSPFRIGEHAFVEESGMSYICGTSGDIALTNGLFITSTDSATRGTSRYPVHSSTASYDVDDKVYYNKQNYICTTPHTGAFDVSNWRVLSVETNDERIGNLEELGVQIDAIRGSAEYPEFSTTQSYSVGARVFEPTSQKNYICTTATSSGAFDSSQWRERSVEYNDEVLEQIREDLPTVDQSFNSRVAYYANLHGLANGNLMPWDSADTCLRSVGADAEFVRTSDQPRYGSELDGLFGADVLIRIPVKAITVRDLLVIKSYRSTGANVNRRVRLFNGVPSTNNEVFPLLGITENTSNVARDIIWKISTFSDDLYLHVENNIICGMEHLNSGIYEATAESKNNIMARMDFYTKQYAKAIDTQMTFREAQFVLDGIGLNAGFRNSAGRVFPMFGRYGMYSAVSTDDPTGDASVVEIIIPQRSVLSNARLNIFRGSVTDNLGYVRLFDGDPTSSGAEIPPSAGISSNGTGDRGQLVGFDIPVTTNDLHIVCNGAIINHIEIVAIPETVTFDTSQQDALRGSSRYSDFSVTATYNAGDYVYEPVNGLNYRARIGVAAGVFDESEWEEVSLQAVYEDLFTGVNIRDRIADLEGSDKLSVADLGDTGSLGFRNRIATVVSRSGYSAGDTLTQEDADYVIASIGAGGTFSTNNNRILPTYQDTNRIGGGTHTDPTTAGPAVEIILDADVIPDSAELYISHTPTATSGSIRVYEGDPVAGGTELPTIYGRNGNSCMFMIGGASTNIHVVCYNTDVQILDILQTPLKELAETSAMGMNRYMSYLSENVGYISNDVLSESDSNSILTRSGAGVTVRRDAGRVLPRLGIGNYHALRSLNGIADPTQNGSCLELIFDRDTMPPKSRIMISYSSMSNGGNRYVNLYDGDPTGTGTRIESVSGIEDNLTPADSTVLVFEIDASGYSPTNNLHLVVSQSQIYDISVEPLVRPIPLYTTYDVTQTSHGFGVLTPVSFDGTTWSAADSTSSLTCAIGIVSEVVNANEFTVQMNGMIYSQSHGLTAGDYYWLGTTGTLDITQPTSGNIQQLLYVLSDDQVLVDIGQVYSA